MTYTVKALADLSGVSERTLRYYDAIDLLRPARIGDNGYRYYDDASAQRLQQILFFRELGFPLRAIKEILDHPDFDHLRALEDHRAALRQRARLLDDLIRTIDKTILRLKGEIEMSDGELFQGFSPEKQAEYEEEMRERYGAEHINESIRRWNSYSKAEQEAIGARGEAIFRALRDSIDQGHDSPAVQEKISALHEHMQHFWPCTLDCFIGLGELYKTHPDFIATFQRIHPALPEFLYDAISHYCIERT